MATKPTPSETDRTESRPVQVHGPSRLITSSVSRSDAPTWEVVERMKDECEANEKLVAEALAQEKYLKAAEYHLNTIKLKEKLSPRYPFPKMAKIEAYTKQLSIVLRSTEPPSRLQPLLPSNWEYLLHPDCQALERDEYGNLYALLGSFYMRSDDREHWSHAKEYLDRALRYLVKVFPQPVSFIAKTAQKLIDIYDLLGEHAIAEGRLQWLKRKTLPELTQGIRIGRISASKLWCREQGFVVQRFDEVDPSKGCSPLAHAVKTKSYGEIETMLSFTAEINPPNDLASELLLIAADTRSSEVARLLITHGAQVTIQDSTRKTVLHRCQHCPKLGNQGGLKVANLFLDINGDLLDKEDKSGKTALYMACESGHFDMADLLLKRGAKPDSVEATGKTALYMACEKGQPNIVKRLLQQHANPNIEGPGKVTPLMVAVMMASKRAEKGRLEVVKELIKFHANPRQKDHKGQDAFHRIGGPLGSELKHALNQAELILNTEAGTSTLKHSLNPAEPIVGTHSSTSESSAKAGHWTPFNSNWSEHLERSPKSALRTSNAPSSSKSTRDSLFSYRTSITNTTIPNSDVNSEYQIMTSSMPGRMNKRPDLLGAPPNLPAIPESLPPKHPKAIETPSNNIDSQPRSPATPAANNSVKSRSRLSVVDLHTELQYPDSLQGRESRSITEELRDSFGTTDTSSLFSYSESSSEVIADHRHSSRQNLPLRIQDLFPIAAQQFNRQHPGASGSQSSRSGARGWASNSPFGNSPHGTGGSSSRAHNNGGDLPEDADRNNNPSDMPGMDGDRQGPDCSLSFACPFAKEHTARHFNCNFYRLIRIKDVKQHLKRKHLLPLHCPRCRMEFSSSQEKDQHLRDLVCRNTYQTELDGITNDQAVELNNRVSSKLSKWEQWYKIFHVVFPRAQSRPSSPYVEPDFGLFGFTNQHGRPIVRQFLQRHHYPRDVTVLEDFIILGVQQVIHAFLERRSPSPMPGPEEGASESGPGVEPHLSAAQNLGEDDTDTENYHCLSPDDMDTREAQIDEETTHLHNHLQNSDARMSDYPEQISRGFYTDTSMAQRWTEQIPPILAQQSSLSLNFGSNTDDIADSSNTQPGPWPPNSNTKTWDSDQHSV